jgi:hypothetical protein
MDSFCLRRKRTLRIFAASRPCDDTQEISNQESCFYLLTDTAAKRNRKIGKHNPVKKKTQHKKSLFLEPRKAEVNQANGEEEKKEETRGGTCTWGKKEVCILTCPFVGAALCKKKKSAVPNTESKIPRGAYM